jgi:hypothetical protein
MAGCIQPQHLLCWGRPLQWCHEVVTSVPQTPAGLCMKQQGAGTLFETSHSPKSAHPFSDISQPHKARASTERLAEAAPRPGRDLLKAAACASFPK